jgi:uncharacterized membrane protein
MDPMSTAAASAAAPRQVEAGRGTAWWSEGWALFMRQPGMWVAMGLLFFVILVVLAFVPVLGTLAGAVLTPVFMGGWMLAARKVEAGGTLDMADLFDGFKDKFNPLLVLGGLMLAANVVIFAVVGALGFGAFMGAIAGGATHSGMGMVAAMGTGALAVLVGLLLGLVVAAAFWFAPALVVLGHMAPVDALKASIAANLGNLLPFLVYGLVYLVAAIAASLLFGLGWLVLAPMTLLTLYTSYQDIYAPPA